MSNVDEKSHKLFIFYNVIFFPIFIFLLIFKAFPLSIKTKYLFQHLVTSTFFYNKMQKHLCLEHKYIIRPEYIMRCLIRTRIYNEIHFTEMHSKYLLNLYGNI